MRRIVIAAIVALLASLLLPGSASADWEQFPCDSGELRAGDAWVDIKQLPTNVNVPGVVKCGVSKPGAKFVVAVFEYGSDHGYYTDPGLMQAYASPSGPTTFTVIGDIQFPMQAVDTGLCIMPDKHTRLSCVLVSTDFTVTQLSTSDPRVMRDIIGLPDVGPSPSCATCFGVTP